MKPRPVTSSKTSQSRKRSGSCQCYGSAHGTLFECNGIGLGNGVTCRGLQFDAEVRAADADQTGRFHPGGDVNSGRAAQTKAFAAKSPTFTRDDGHLDSDYRIGA